MQFKDIWWIMVSHSVLKAHLPNLDVVGRRSGIFWLPERGD